MTLEIMLKMIWWTLVRNWDPCQQRWLLQRKTNNRSAACSSLQYHDISVHVKAEVRTDDSRCQSDHYCHSGVSTDQSGVVSWHNGHGGRWPRAPPPLLTKSTCHLEIKHFWLANTFYWNILLPRGCLTGEWGFYEVEHNYCWCSHPSEC